MGRKPVAQALLKQLLVAAKAFVGLPSTHHSAVLKAEACPIWIGAYPLNIGHDQRADSRLGALGRLQRSRHQHAEVTHALDKHRSSNGFLVAEVVIQAADAGTAGRANHLNGGACYAVLGETRQRDVDDLAFLAPAFRLG